jgi:hypothetical protein
LEAAKAVVDGLKPDGRRLALLATDTSWRGQSAAREGLTLLRPAELMAVVMPDALLAYVMGELDRIVTEEQGGWCPLDDADRKGAIEEFRRELAVVQKQERTLIEEAKSIGLQLVPW